MRKIIIISGGKKGMDRFKINVFHSLVWADREALFHHIIQDFGFPGLLLHPPLQQ